MVIGSVIVFTVIAIALLAPLLAPHDPYQQDLMKRLLPPFGIVVAAGSIFSALITLVDYLSFDLWRRISLIGIGAAIISGLIGTIMGVMAGYFGGRGYGSNVLNYRALINAGCACCARCSGNCWRFATGCDYSFRSLLWDRFAVVMRSSTLQVRSMIMLPQRKRSDVRYHAF